MFQLNLKMVQNFYNVFRYFCNLFIVIKEFRPSKKVLLFISKSAILLTKKSKKELFCCLRFSSKMILPHFLESDTTCQLKAWHVNHNMPLRKNQCLGQKVIHLLLDKIELNLKYFLQES